MTIVGRCPACRALGYLAPTGKYAAKKCVAVCPICRGAGALWARFAP